jgi:hypothetical protein
MQTGSSETLIGWKSGKTTYGTEWRERGYGLWEISNAGRENLDFAGRDKCKSVLLRLSLAGNLEKPLMSLYRTEWRERGYGLWALII